jgi:hypothetical protein
MSVHFDRAMQTLNPLATLYGLSQDAANQLLAEPEKSGVNDVVLKVAAMRGRQEQMASVQRSAMGTLLPGPSPNNRKLNLYKVRLPLLSFPSLSSPPRWLASPSFPSTDRVVQELGGEG